MSMTFLQLVNRARQECGVSGDDLTVLTSLTGEALRFKNWVIKANRDIATARDNWLWLRASTSFVTVANQGSYTATEAGATNFKKWLPKTFRYYVTATGYSSEQKIAWQDSWDDFRDTYLFGAQRTKTGQPAILAIAPNKSLYFAQIPADTSFTIVGDYYKKPVELSADADTQAFPEAYDMLTVYRTMYYYGMFEAAPETLATGKMEYRRMMSEMERDQLPEIELADPLT